VPARVVLLVTSPRLPAGLLTAAAWDLVRSAPVFAATELPALTPLRANGAEVRVGVDQPGSAVLAAAQECGTAVWFAGPDGDQALARDLGLRLAREPGLAELELMYGSWDPPGARLLDAVTVLDRLLSPGGDPWKQAQTHRSLAPYLLEECYETFDAIEAGDTAALREELGDLLLQIVLHARLAEQLPAADAWSIDDVAGDLVAKMVRRNPHVFAGTAVADLDEIVENWERIKREEKSRGSVLDGVALAQPALALAAKVLARADRAAVAVDVPAGMSYATEDELGAALLAVVAQARTDGFDAEAALRRAVLAQMAAIRATEPPPSTEPSAEH